MREYGENREPVAEMPSRDMIAHVHSLVLRPEMRERKDAGYLLWEATGYDFKPGDIAVAENGSAESVREGLAKELAGKIVAGYRERIKKGGERFAPWEALRIAKEFFPESERVEKVAEAVRASFEHYWSQWEAYPSATRHLDHLVGLWRESGYDPGDGRLQKAMKAYLEDLVKSGRRSSASRQAIEFQDAGVFDFEKDADLFEALTEPEG